MSGHVGLTDVTAGDRVGCSAAILDDVAVVSAFRGEAARKMAGAQKSWVKVVPVGPPT